MYFKQIDEIINGTKSWDSCPQVWALTFEVVR